MLYNHSPGIKYRGKRHVFLSDFSLVRQAISTVTLGLLPLMCCSHLSEFLWLLSIITLPFGKRVKP